MPVRKIAMATNTQVQSTSTDHHDSSEARQAAKKDSKSLQAFFTKFNNDWVMNFATGLAFNLITAIFPILIAIIAILGLTIGPPASTAQQNIINPIFDICLAQIVQGA